MITDYKRKDFLRNALFVRMQNENEFNSPCEFCLEMEKALLVVDCDLPPERKIPIIHNESGDPRLYRLNNVFKKMNTEYIGFPVTSLNGTAYVGTSGMLHAIGLIRGALNEHK